jgi:tetratricopeptide (TPR) repeat protein
VQAYVQGVVRPHAGALRLELALVDVARGVPVYTLDADATTRSGLPAVIDDVADAVLARIGRPPLEHDRRAGAAIDDFETLRTYNLGQRYLAQHDATRAVVQFRRAFATNPEFASAGLWLAVARDWIGDRVGARAALNQTLLVIHRLPEKERHLLLALHAKLDNDVTTALGQLDGLLVRYPDETYARFLRGDIAFHAGLYDIAVERLRDLLAHDADHELARHHWLWALHMHGEPGRARQAATRWRQTDGPAAAFVAEMELSLANRDPEHARHVAMAGAARFPHDARFIMMPPVLAAARGDVAAVQAALDAQLPEPVSSDRVRRIEIRRRMAWIQAYQGAFAQADATYGTLIAEFVAREPTLSESKRRSMTYFRAEWAWLLAQRPQTRTRAWQIIKSHLLDPQVLRLKPVARYVALSCWTLRRWPCLDQAAQTEWPIPTGLEAAFRSWRIEGPLAARARLADLMQQTEVYYSDAIRMLRAQLSIDLGDIDAARRDLHAWDVLRFARPQHMFTRPWARCQTAVLDGLPVPASCRGVGVPAD